MRCNIYIYMYESVPFSTFCELIFFMCVCLYVCVQLVLDKSQERRLGMSMLNALQRSDGKRKTWMKPGRYLYECVCM